jgi:hypothetical protein
MMQQNKARRSRIKRNSAAAAADATTKADAAEANANDVPDSAESNAIAAQQRWMRQQKPIAEAANAQQQQLTQPL